MIGQYSVGPGLGAITFDGKNIWISGDGVVTELSLGGVVKDTYSLGFLPVGLAFDGTNLLDPTQSSGIVKLPAGGGAAETYTAPVASGQAPTTIVFDGTNMWLGVRNVQSSLPSNTVFELSLSDVTIGTFVVGPDTFPMGLTVGTSSSRPSTATSRCRAPTKRWGSRPATVRSAINCGRATGACARLVELPHARQGKTMV